MGVMSFNEQEARLQQLACRACYGACCLVFMFPGVVNNSTLEPDPGMTKELLALMNDDGALAAELFMPYTRNVAVRLLGDGRSDYGLLDWEKLPGPPSGYSWRSIPYTCSAYEAKRHRCSIYHLPRPYACGRYHCGWKGDQSFPRTLLANTLVKDDVIKACEKRLSRFHKRLGIDIRAEMDATSEEMLLQDAVDRLAAAVADVTEADPVDIVESAV